MYLNLDDPIEPSSYEAVEQMILEDRITNGRLRLLFDDNPDFCHWYNERCLERHFGDEEWTHETQSLGYLT